MSTISIINTLRKHTTEMNSMFIKCLKIVKLYPPAKNEYKFLFGQLIQMSVIECFGRVFYKCVDLDTVHTVGSQYKNDCRLYVDSSVWLDISIKAKSKRNGQIILINKHSSSTHNLTNLLTCIVILENSQVVFIPYNLVPPEFIKDTNAYIAYKQSIITYFYKNHPEYIIKLSPNHTFNQFYKHVYPSLLPKNIYQIEFSKL